MENDFLLTHLSRLKKLEKKKGLSPDAVIQIQIEIIAANYILTVAPDGYIDKLDNVNIESGMAITIARGALFQLYKEGVDASNVNEYILKKLDLLESTSTSTEIET